MRPTETVRERGTGWGSNKGKREKRNVEMQWKQRKGGREQRTRDMKVKKKRRSRGEYFFGGGTKDGVVTDRKTDKERERKNACRLCPEL